MFFYYQYLQELIDYIYVSIIERYIHMGTAQHFRDFRRSHQLKKSAELRKRVLQRQKKNQEKSDSVPFQVSVTFLAVSWRPHSIDPMATKACEAMYGISNITISLLIQ